MLYEYLKKNLYDPLGYKVFKEYNFSNVIHELITLSKNDAMIHPEIDIPDEDEFL